MALKLTNYSIATITRNSGIEPTSALTLWIRFRKDANAVGYDYASLVSKAYNQGASAPWSSWRVQCDVNDHTVLRGVVTVNGTQYNSQNQYILTDTTTVHDFFYVIYRD